MATKPLIIPDHLERRYTYAGRVAHLIDSTLGMANYTGALCGFSGEWGSPWLGSGSYAESQEAAKMRLCRRCEENLRRRLFLRERWGQRGAPIRAPHKAYEGRCESDGAPWPCPARLKEMRAQTRT